MQTVISDEPIHSHNQNSNIRPLRDGNITMRDVDPISDKLKQIFAPHSSLQRQDLIWILESIKNKVAEEDPSLLSLPQPRLLKNFHCFAEIAMLLIHQRTCMDQQLDRLKTWIYEACYGLTEDD